MSSQSNHGRRISEGISIGQSPHSRADANFKNVRNMEIKEKIAKINEASGSDDDSPLNKIKKIEEDYNNLNLNYGGDQG